MWAAPIVALVAAVLLHALIMPLFKRQKLHGKHVLMTGGSKGLGLALAKEFIKRACHVTVVARKQVDLLDALQTLNEFAASLSQDTSVKIQALSADTTKSDEIATACTKATATTGPIDILVCNAGLSIPGLFLEQQMSAFEQQIEVNYLGTVRTIKCVLPQMLDRRRGRILITTSVLSVLGFAGYTSYAPSKWALRGLADSLRNELQGTGISVSVAYPPDTDTPGYATENLSKPGLCKKVNTALGSQLFSPEIVAAKLVRQFEAGRYHLTTPDIGTNMLISMMTGLSPKSHPLALGFFLSPILQLVSSVVAAVADDTAKKYNRDHGYPERK